MSFIQRFFMIFGIFCFILFIGLIAAGSYLWIKDPFGIKPLISSVKEMNTFGDQSNAVTTTDTPSAADANTPSSLLTQEQKKLLNAAGININNLPKEITPELKTCAETKLGKERVAALKAGAQPTLSDLLAAKACIQ